MSYLWDNPHFRWKKRPKSIVAQCLEGIFPIDFSRPEIENVCIRLKCALWRDSVHTPSGIGDETI